MDSEASAFLICSQGERGGGEGWGGWEAEGDGDDDTTSAL